MTYTSVDNVKALAKINYDELGYGSDAEYEAFINDLITYAESIVDSHCNVPSGFFNAGGLSFTDQLYDFRYSLQLRYYPVLSVSAVKVNTAGYGQTPSWSTLDSTDYIVDKHAGIIHFVSGDIPAVAEQSVKVSYTAGYNTTPYTIAYVTAQLCSNIIHIILQKKISPVIRVDDWAVRLVLPEAFTRELQFMLTPFIRRSVGVG
jgi:hypothetical protein